MFTRKQTAKEDIVVYKRLCEFGGLKNSKMYETPYREFKVKLGETYTSGLKRRSIFYFKICNIGLHSYENVTDAFDNQYHYWEVIVKCIIPKGSKYYKGKFLHYNGFASDKLIYTKEIIEK